MIIYILDVNWMRPSLILASQRGGPPRILDL